MAHAIYVKRKHDGSISIWGPFGRHVSSIAAYALFHCVRTVAYCCTEMMADAKLTAFQKRTLTKVAQGSSLVTRYEIREANIAWIEGGAMPLHVHPDTSQPNLQQPKSVPNPFPKSTERYHAIRTKERIPSPERQQYRPKVLSTMYPSVCSGMSLITSQAIVQKKRKSYKKRWRNMATSAEMKNRRTCRRDRLSRRKN